MSRPAKRAESLLSDPGVIFEATKLFLQGNKATEIAKKINGPRNLKGVDGLSREQVYGLIQKAYKGQMLELHVPVNDALRQRLLDRFAIDRSPNSPYGRKDISVVSASASDSNMNVAQQAARIALDQAYAIRDARQGDSATKSAAPSPSSPRAGRASRAKALPDPKAVLKPKDESNVITLGLGPGQGTLDFVRHFGHLLETRDDPVFFRLVSLSSGCLATYPHLAATSMFNLLPEQFIVERYGMFAGNLVKARNFSAVTQRPGVRESFEIRDKIDLIVSAMGDFSDPYDLLRQHLKAADVKVKELRDSDGEPYVGNVQYRPYTRKGFVTNEALRAVTLFELDDLVRIAKAPYKAVILIVRRRTYDGKTRAAALRPLLENRRMQLFSHLVIDDTTARELLDDERAP